MIVPFSSRKTKILLVSSNLTLFDIYLEINFYCQLFKSSLDKSYLELNNSFALLPLFTAYLPLCLLKVLCLLASSTVVSSETIVHWCVRSCLNTQLFPRIFFVVVKGTSDLNMQNIM